MKPNDIQVSEHFTLCEFDDKANGNLVVLHPLTIERLEKLHLALSESMGRPIAILITCGTRTPRTNNQLAKLLGWTDDGGLVSKTSKHLPRFGGIAADLQVLDIEFGQLMPIRTVAQLAASFFDTIIDHYPTHIHVDLRDSANPGAPSND